MVWIEVPYETKKLNAKHVAHVAIMEGEDPRAVDVFDYFDWETFSHRYYVSTRRGPRVEWQTMCYESAFDIAWDLTKEAEEWNSELRCFNGVARGRWVENWKKPVRRRRAVPA